MIQNQSVWGQLRDRADNNVWDLVGSGAPTNGTSGTGANLAGIGSQYVDIATGYAYRNTGTKASPTWTTGASGNLPLASGKLIVGNSSGVAASVTPTGDVTISNAGVTAVGAGKILESMLGAASLVGLGAFRYAKATYDFAVDGGAISTLTPASTAVIPINAIIIGGIIDVITPGTTSASGTMAIGTTAGSSSASLKAALAAASYTGLLATIPVFTAANAVKMTAAGSINVTIATGALTAGKWNILVAYFIGG